MKKVLYIACDDNGIVESYGMDKFIFYNVAYLGGNLELASKLVKRFPEDLMEIEKFFKSDSLSNEDLLKWESFKNGLDI